MLNNKPDEHPRVLVILIIYIIASTHSLRNLNISYSHLMCGYPYIRVNNATHKVESVFG